MLRTDPEGIVLPAVDPGEDEEESQLLSMPTSGAVAVGDSPEAALS